MKPGAHGEDGGRMRPPAAARPAASRPARARALLRAWFDGGAGGVDAGDPRRIDLLRQVPFVAIHAGCLALPWVGASPVAVAVAVALYALRMFAITGFYHRYFSHRTFRTSRAVHLIILFIFEL